jgi:hypothetical protein
MKWARFVACIWQKRTARRFFMGKLEGNRPLERPRRMWVENICKKLDGMVLTRLNGLRIGTVGRLYEDETNLWAPKIVGKNLEMSECVASVGVMP